MFLDFSVLFDRLGEQMAVIMIMAQRQAVQRQIVTVALILVLTALAPRVLRRLLRLWSTAGAGASDAAGASSTWRSRIVRGLRAIDFILFPALLLFTYRAIGWYASNDWPSGLIEGMLPIFWLLFVYRLLVQLVLKALPKDQSERFATELLRPIVLILILLIARNLLFSTLGLGEISLLRLGDIVLNLGALLDGMIVILAAFLVGGAVRKALLNMMIRGEMEADVANTVSNVVRYSIVGLGVLVAIGILGIELSALGWIAGGLVVGLGFGLQELFANFVSGIVLVFERIVRPGDVIELDGIRGSVTKVLLRATVLQTPDSAEIVVPNKELMTRSVLALTYSDRITRVRLDISVAFDSDLPLVEQVLLTTIQSHPLILETPQPRAWITALDPHSVQVLAFGYVADFSQLFQVRSDLHQMVRDAFVIHGIVVPYPRQDVRVFAGDRERGVERDLVF